jgi:hypothetical protein
MIQLVNPERICTYETDGAAFQYHEALPRDVDSIYQSCTRTGAGGSPSMDLGKIKDRVLKRYAIGWSGVTDAQGKEIPFSPEMIDYLPGRIRDGLYLRIIGNAGQPSQQAEDGPENP